MPQEHEVTEKDFFNTIEIAQRFGNLKLNKKFYLREIAEKKEENNNPLLLECAAYYNFSKFLLEDKHKISKFANKSIASFREQLPIVQNKKEFAEKVVFIWKKKILL